MKIAIIIVTILATLFCICACQLYPAPTPTNPTQTKTMPTQTQPTDPAPTESIDPRIAEMQALLEYKGKYDLYNFALLSDYASPAEIDLYYLFYYGFKDETKKLTKNEVEYLNGRLGPNAANQEVVRLPVDKMDAVLEDMFGITLAQTNRVGLDRLIYLEETDCYYGQQNGSPYASVFVQSVEDQDDGTIRVYYRRGNNPYDELVIILRAEGDGYKIVSNQYEDPMLGEMQVLLEWPSDNRFYNYALTSEYATPADVNMLNLFQNGFPEESDDPTEEELVLLEGKLGEFWKEMDLARLPVEKMDAVLTELFGITLEQTNGVGLDSLVYLEETNCYYTANTGVYYAEITVSYVETLDDGSLMVQYATPYNGDFMVKLMPTDDGGHRILSNTAISDLYNKAGIRSVVSAYFEQREAYLLGKAESVEYTSPGIVPEEEKHLAAIASAGIDWLKSEASVGEVDCWDSHAEAVVTEEIAYRKDGIVYKESIIHKLQLVLTDDGTILVVCDSYTEKASGFTSCFYVPPELAQ